MDWGAWRTLLTLYGQEVTLKEASGGKTVRAFFQPVREMKAEESPTRLGKAPEGEWLYLGPAEEELEQVRSLVWDGREFELIRRRDYQLGTETLYHWALCREMDEVAE